MTTALLPAAILLAAFLNGSAPQQASPPGLQQRSPATSEEQVKVIREGGKAVLPDDASGLYRFDTSKSGRTGNFGEGVQIDQQFDEITGYLTLAPDNGHGNFNTYFLNEVRGGSGHLAFTTHAVHGIWYSFDGHLVRGLGQSRAEDGYWVMDGVLTLHDAGQTTHDRTISLKLTAQH